MRPLPESVNVIMPPATPRMIQHPERLAAVGRLHLLDTPPEPSLDRLTRLAAQLLHSPAAYISLVTDHQLYFVSQTGLPESLAETRQLPLAYSLCQHAIESGMPLVIDDARTHPLAVDNPSVEEYQCVAFLGIPLRVGDSLPVGALCVMEPQPRAWSESDVAGLSDLAGAVQTELRLRVLYQEQTRLQTYIHRLEQNTIEFLRSATHKLLSPINVIQGYLDMESEACSSSSMIMESIEEMRLIIHDLMTVSQVEDITRVSDEPVNLVETIQQVVQRLTAQATAHGQTLQMALPSGLTVKGSSGQLHEAAVNLIGNAMKYTPDGGSISILLREEDGQGIFEVKDTGYGIPVEYQSSLFQPFYRVVTRETAPIKGTGLGLYLVKAIITRHGGQIFFQSTGGQGSTFGFKLPVYPVESSTLSD
jgi:signal transduction histidine kinase